MEQYKASAKSYVHMQRGIHLEKRIIERLNSAENMNFVARDKLWIKAYDNALFKICGIVDGIDAQKQTIIEVKTKSRLSASLSGVSLKERVQCMCYMSLTGCDKCILVESGPCGEQNVFHIVMDVNEFECIVLDKLRRFVNKYRNMDEDEFKRLVLKYSLSY